MIFEIPDISGLTCKISDPEDRILKIFEQSEMIYKEEGYQLMIEIMKSYISPGEVNSDHIRDLEFKQNKRMLKIIQSRQEDDL